MSHFSSELLTEVGGSGRCNHLSGTVVYRTVLLQKECKIVRASNSLSVCLSCFLEESSQVADGKTQGSLSLTDSFGIVCTVWTAPEGGKKRKKKKTSYFCFLSSRGHVRTLSFYPSHTPSLRNLAKKGNCDHVRTLSFYPSHTPSLRSLVKKGNRGHVRTLSFYPPMNELSSTSYPHSV